MLISDRKGMIEYVNPMFTQLTGYSIEDLRGKTPRVLKSSRTTLSVYEDLWRTILSGRTWHGEICNRRKNGEEFWESISINSIRDSQGVITHFVAVWQDVTARRKHDEDELCQKQHFEKQSRTDELTGLYNRRHIFVALEREFERARRYERPLSGMMIDIDDFKKINDQYGHLTGDPVLRTFARVLKKSIRTVDILGRYGGDEFLLILPETQIEKARIVAERIRKNLRDYQENVMNEFGVLTASIGLVSFEGRSRDDKALFLEKIDKVLLLAKRAGKNTVVIG
jgi:diguanylate cyclase (GGDEF)-like protein/PAS domain S-box-containing protein